MLIRKYCLLCALRAFDNTDCILILRHLLASTGKYWQVHTPEVLIPESLGIVSDSKRILDQYKLEFLTSESQTTMYVCMYVCMYVFF